MPGHEQAPDDKVLDVLSQVDELRRHGFDAAGIAEAMAARGAPVPAGGQWSVNKVERILEAFDSIRDEAEPVAAATEPAPNPGSGPAGQPEPMVAAVPVAATVAMDGDADRGGRRRGATAVRWGALTLAMAGLGAGGFLALDAIAGSGGDQTRLTGEAAPSSPTTEAPNPADTMAIRIETDQEPSIDLGDDEDGADDAASVGADGDLAPATATIKDDGLLYVEGAFSDQAAATRYIEGAAEVFGRENIVEAYVVDAAAPEAKVADVALDKPVLFETGTAVIHPDYIAFLEACAGVLELNPHIVMSVTAHTDSVGSEEFNLELSQRRAQAIVDFYRDREIGDDQLVAAGVGEADPVAPNDSDEGRSRNRRAMLELLNVVGDEAAAVD